jgi:DNA-binding response OmpR family regulator
MKILIAEDDPVSCLALQSLLQKLGHELVVAANGAQAWANMSKSWCPVAILDWMMPEMDGIEVCRRIKSQAGSGYCCVIMLTAKQERQDRMEALAAGADVFLTKPLNKEDLIARLQVAERILAIEKRPGKVLA